jgi:glycosyltransferase involved in cell wall biosynthesis
LLSICIPTYNREKWLFQNLSLLNELSNNCKKKLEIIISDNNSTDNTKETVQKFKDLPIKYYRREVNYNFNNNFQFVVQKATKKFVWVLGDDDLVLPSFIDILINTMEINQNVNFYCLRYECHKIPYLDSKIKAIDSVYLTGKLNTNISFSKYKIHQFNDSTFGYFNAISSFILKRKYALNVYDFTSIGEKIFTSVENTFPFACYIIDNYINEFCFVTNTPVLLCNTGMSWSRYYCITWLLFYPDLVLRFHKAINKKANKITEIDYIIKSKFLELLMQYKVEEVSFSKRIKLYYEIFKRYYFYFSFWKVVIKVSLKSIKKTIYLK